MKVNLNITRELPNWKGQTVLDLTNGYHTPVCSNNTAYHHLENGALKVLFAGAMKFPEGQQMPGNSVLLVPRVNDSDYLPSRHEVVMAGTPSLVLSASVLHPYIAKFGVSKINSLSLTLLKAIHGLSGFRTDVTNVSILLNLMFPALAKPMADVTVFGGRTSLGLFADLIIDTSSTKGGKDREYFNRMFSALENNEFPLKLGLPEQVLHSDQVLNPALAEHFAIIQPPITHTRDNGLIRVRFQALQNPIHGYANAVYELLRLIAQQQAG